MRDSDPIETSITVPRVPLGILVTLRHSEQHFQKVTLRGDIHIGTGNIETPRTDLTRMTLS